MRMAEKSDAGAKCVPEVKNAGAECLQSSELSLLREHIATAGCLRLTDKAWVDVRMSGKEAVDNRADLTIMGSVPMSEPV